MLQARITSRGGDLIPQHLKQSSAHSRCPYVNIKYMNKECIFDLSLNSGLALSPVNGDDNTFSWSLLGGFHGKASVEFLAHSRRPINSVTVILFSGTKGSHTIGSCLTKHSVREGRKETLAVWAALSSQGEGGRGLRQWREWRQAAPSGPQAAGGPRSP